MRTAVLLPALLLLALGTGACEGRPTSVLDLHTRKAPPRPFPDAIREAGALEGSARVLPAPPPALPEQREDLVPPDAEPAPEAPDAGVAAEIADGGDAGQLPRGLTGTRLGDSVTYSFTVQPNTTDAFKAFTVRATFTVKEVSDQHLRLMVRLEPDHQAPPAMAFDGWLELKGPLKDDFAVKQEALTCTRSGRRCTVKRVRPGDPTVAVEPKRRVLSVGGFLVQHQQRLDTGRARRIALVSPQSTFGAGPPLILRDTVTDHVTPLTWAWRRIASLAPPLYVEDADFQDLTGTRGSDARRVVLDARAAAMSTCRFKHPGAGAVPMRPFALRLTVSPDGKVIDSAVQHPKDPVGGDAFVQCVQVELARRIALPQLPRGGPPAIIELLIPQPD